MIKINCGGYHLLVVTLFWELCSACIIKLMLSSESFNKVIRTDRSISRSFIYLKCMVLFSFQIHDLFVLTTGSSILAVLAVCKPR